MKNTKKAVALALALSVSSQAVPSFAEGLEVKETSDVVAPSSSTSLETTVNPKTNEITIIQKAIYDLESGLDVNSVKAYVYEEGSDDKGKAVEMDGNDFSDFTVTTSIPSTDGNLVVEVYASDLAGNETEINSTVVEKSASAVGNNYIDYLFDPSNGYLKEDFLKINPNKPLLLSLDFEDVTNDLSEIKVIINNEPSIYSSGILYTGKVSKENGISCSSNTGSIDITDSSFENSGTGFTKVNLNIDSSKLPNNSTYNVWVTDGNGNYKNIGPTIMVDSKAPESKDEVDLTLSVDNVLFITQDGVEDISSDVKDVYALIKNENLKDPVKCQLASSEDSITGGLYEGSIDLKTLGIEKGTFQVEVYAIDNCGNEGVISSGTITKDISIESEELMDILGQGAEDGDAYWFRYNSLITIVSRSESKSKVYNGAQIIINEDSNDYTKKVLAEFKVGSQEDLTNINDNKYFELKDKKYTTVKSTNGNYDYANTVESNLIFKDGAYNKNLNIWVVYYTDDGIVSKASKFEKQIKTDYVAPTVTINKESNNYVINAADNESGIASVVVYDANGLIIDYNHEDAMTISEDLNPSTVTVIDKVDNEVVYNIKTGEIIDGVGSTDLPVGPIEDEYIEITNPGDVNDGEVPDDGANDETPDDENPVDDDNAGDNNADDNTTGGDNNANDNDGDNNNGNNNNNSNNNNNGNNNINTDNTTGDNVNNENPSNGNNTNGTNDDGNNTDGNQTTDGDQSTTDGTNNVVSNPSNNDSTNSVVDKVMSVLPQTGNATSIFAVAVGGVTSALGFILSRKKK